MPLQMSAMLRLSLAFKHSKESMFSVISSLAAKDGCMRSRLDKRLGGGSAAMLAKLSSAQMSRNDKLLHSVLLQPCTLPRDSKRHNPLCAAGSRRPRLPLLRPGCARRDSARRRPRLRIRFNTLITAVSPPPAFTALPSHAPRQTLCFLATHALRL